MGREIAWLAVAVGMAFLLAGEVVRRSAYHKSLPWRQSFFSLGRYQVDLRNGEAVLVEEYASDAGETQVWPASARMSLEYSAQFGEAREIGSRFLLNWLRSDGPRLWYERVGWPMVFAEYTTLDRLPLDGATTGRAETEWRVDNGLFSVGSIGFATRPLMPGFLVLVTACEAVITIARVGVWLMLDGRRRTRRRRGLCGRCGYDLAGLSGGVCPECGEGVV